MISWIIRIRGSWRIYWGSCPICNSDAPEMDVCQFCGSFYGWRDKMARRMLLIRWLAFTRRNWGMLDVAVDRQLVPNVREEDR